MLKWKYYNSDKKTTFVIILGMFIIVFVGWVNLLINPRKPLNLKDMQISEGKLTYIHEDYVMIGKSKLNTYSLLLGNINKVFYITEKELSKLSDTIHVGDSLKVYSYPGEEPYHIIAQIERIKDSKVLLKFTQKDSQDILIIMFCFLVFLIISLLIHIIKSDRYVSKKTKNKQ